MVVVFVLVARLFCFANRLIAFCLQAWGDELVSAAAARQVVIIVGATARLPERCHVVVSGRARYFWEVKVTKDGQDVTIIAGRPPVRHHNLNHYHHRHHYDHHHHHHHHHHRLALIQCAPF